MARECAVIDQRNIICSINSHNNFLVLSGHTETNLKGSTLSFEVPNNYNQLELIILTPESAMKKKISLTEGDAK